MTKLYTVPIDVLATYQATVAADNPSEAQSIARDVSRCHIQKVPPRFALSNHDVSVQEAVEAAQPVQRYRVSGIYQIDFEMTVPASNRADAVLHARRLYDVNCGPFEFEHDGGALVRLTAEEVLS